MPNSPASTPEQFDSEAFIETLREISVDDPSAANRRFWMKAGKQFNGLPNTSIACVSSVATALRQNPTQIQAIFDAVDKFYDQSTGVDSLIQSNSGDSMRGHLNTLSRERFYKKVIESLLSGPPSNDARLSELSTQTQQAIRTGNII